jgi:hypothetical protein
VKRFTEHEGHTFFTVIAGWYPNATTAGQPAMVVLQKSSINDFLDPKQKRNNKVIDNNMDDSGAYPLHTTINCSHCSVVPTTSCTHQRQVI